MCNIEIRVIYAYGNCTYFFVNLFVFFFNDIVCEMIGAAKGVRCQ